jgi:hypothetical protein
MKRLAGWSLVRCHWLRFPTTVEIYSPPATHRKHIPLNPGWRFIRQDATGAQTSNFDDSAWATVNLPHTWNNLDGQDGSNTNREFFLKLDGVFLVADVYVNGNFLGEHQGGFAAFVFDATPYINVGGDNVIAVKVNNAANTNIPPLDADFTMFGGLYHDVHLLVTDPVSVLTGATLAPGTSAIGTLTMNDALTNTSVTFIKVSKTGSTIANDNIKGVTTLVFGGTLVVTNIGPGIVTVGDSLKIFSATTYKGSFTTISPPTPGTGLVWNTNHLNANGTLTVVLGNVHPQLGALALNGTNLMFNGSGGAAASGFSLSTSTNLTVPLTSWCLVRTGVFDGTGNFSFTNNIQPEIPHQFYEINIP